MFEETMKEVILETLGYVPTDEELEEFKEGLDAWYDEEHKYP